MPSLPNPRSHSVEFTTFNPSGFINVIFHLYFDVCIAALQIVYLAVIKYI